MEAFQLCLGLVPLDLEVASLGRLAEALLEVVQTDLSAVDVGGHVGVEEDLD